MDNERLREYHRLFSEVWKLFKDHCTASSEADWNKLMDAAGALYRAQESQEELCRGLVLCVLNEVQRLDKERRGKR